MHCFNHQSITAVGMCKHCGKGLCAGCAVDLGHGLACPDHQQEVENVRSMITKARAAQSTNSRFRYLTPLFFFVLGSLLIGFSLANPGPATRLLLVIGLPFLAYAIVVFFVMRRAFGTPTEAPTAPTKRPSTDASDR